MNGDSGHVVAPKKEPIGWVVSIQKKIYDGSQAEKIFLGRTAKSWLQLSIFYVVFYSVLAVMLALCMRGLLATLDEKEPKWKLSESLIGANPGLTFRPIPYTLTDQEKGYRIEYDSTNGTTTAQYVKLLNDFLAPYKRENQEGKNFQVCHFNSTTSPNPGHVCVVDIDQPSPCSEEHNYGYNSLSPCVFIKLNKVFGWTPEFYTEPIDGMPEDLKLSIKESGSGGPAENNQVWVSCDVARKSERGQVEFSYYLSRGFPEFYFPFNNADNYLSPLVAVQIKYLTPNVKIRVECKAWAKNLDHENRENLLKLEIISKL